ncbi:MAG TPA: stage II sporulation protein M, partial [Acidobacteriaceae bacterium]|nr:stage II sporulation protein M [Acidobacteriaceae bacterium]
FVVPHGSLELPSIVLAGAAGLRLAAGLLFPGMYSRRYSIAVAGAESGRLVAGIIPLLVIAGILEGFFSPATTIPVPLKFVTGAVLFCALLTWLFGGGGEPVTEPEPAQSRLASLTSR